MTSYHVKSCEGYWVLIRPKAEAVWFITQNEAWEECKKLAKKSRGVAKLFSEVGKLIRTHSYGKKENKS